MGFQAHFLSLKAYYQVQPHHPSSTPQSWPLSSSPHARITAFTQALFLQTLHRSSYWAVAQDFAGVGLARPTIHQLSTNLRNGWTSPLPILEPGKNLPCVCRRRQKPGKAPFNFKREGIYYNTNSHELSTNFIINYSRTAPRKHIIYEIIHGNHGANHGRGWRRLVNSWRTVGV